MARTAYIYDEKTWSQNFLYSLYMACTEHIYDEKFGPKTSPKASTWPVQPRYTSMTKNVGPETSPTASTWPVQPIYTTKNWAEDFPYSLYMARTAYIYDEKRWSGDFP
jgi:hypothetical protein